MPTPTLSKSDRLLAVVPDIGTPLDIALQRDGQQRVVALSLEAVPTTPGATDLSTGHS